MTWLFLGVLVVLVVAARQLLHRRRRRELAAKDAFRRCRKLASEDARRLLNEATSAEDIRAVTTALGDARFAHACALVRRDDRALPERRNPCFFDPQHGPAVVDAAWKPPSGIEGEIAVCLPDAHRLASGEAPDVRMVRVGDRWVPWFAAGEAYDAYAHGYFGPGTAAQTRAEETNRSTSIRMETRAGLTRGAR